MYVGNDQVGTLIAQQLVKFTVIPGLIGTGHSPYSGRAGKRKGTTLPVSYYQVNDQLPVQSLDCVVDRLEATSVTRGQKDNSLHTAPNRLISSDRAEYIIL
jgi:hypothetical protein